ncbi:MAG TPA: carbohydrate ABC transporter permease [Microbacterium sp.]|uniref:carbohydrate ABC transporter permease n=1 Tax=Microbacterium sp. TaxID=51671 RepID=UPI002F9323C6
MALTETHTAPDTAAVVAGTRPPRRMRISVDHRAKSRALILFAWVALLLWAAYTVLPILWLVIAGTKTGSELATQPAWSFGSIQNVVNAWANVAAFNNGVIYSWIWNTVVLTVGQLALTLAVTIPAGYALGACSFRLRKPALAATLALILLPGGALVLPQFLEMVALGLIGTRWAVILPGSVFPLGIYLTFIFFSTTIGRDVYDAARIDGASEWRIFARIALPLSWPIVALVGFFSFVRSWGEFILPYIMLRSSDFPLSVGLAVLASTSPDLNPNVISNSNIGIPEVILTTIITMLPVMLVLVLAQRIVLKGSNMMGGALRG